MGEGIICARTYCENFQVRIDDRIKEEFLVTKCTSKVDPHHK